MVIFIKSFKKRFLIFLAVCFTVMTVSYIRTFTAVPGRITLLEGKEYTYNFKSPFMVSIKADRSGMVDFNNGKIKSDGGYFTLSNPFSLKTKKRGSVSLSMRVMGFIPLKTMKVDIVSNKKVVACGNTIGVKLKLSGILVIGVSDVETRNGRKQPSRESNIRAGDLLTEINGKRVATSEELIKEIDNSGGRSIRIKYQRRGNNLETTVKPALSIDDDRYHIGIWVRDSTAGIGTLTFYDPDTGAFGALGHGITDIDTGTLMPVKTGEILQSNILSVVKGLAGTPGELKGIFVESRNKLGTVMKNTQYGIYGVFNNTGRQPVAGRLYPIGLRYQIKEGPATILANVNGKKVEEYAIEIVRVSKQNFTGSKGMVIKVTDKKLLNNTGGIVQGMSGSPIIQNGRIIGAVTHVLVNDPTRGYGIYIEWMLKNTAEYNNLEKAG